MNFEILYTNIRSLRNKIHDIEWELNNHLNVQVISLTETHLSSEIYHGELSITGYQLFRKDRNLHGGGIAVYVKDNIKSSTIDLLSDSESLLLKLEGIDFSIFLLTVYRPPDNNNPALIPSLLDEVSRMMNDPNTTLIICGDFNMPTINWQNYTASGCFPICSPFLYKVNELNLEQHIFNSTHNKGNILDLVFTNKPVVKDILIKEPLLSDHSIILLTLDLMIQTKNRDHSVEIFLFKDADTSEGSKIFLEWEQRIKTNIIAKNSINGVYELFIKGLQDLKANCVPSKIAKFTDQPRWFNNKIKNALKKQRKLYAISKSCPTQYNSTQYNKTRKKNKKMIKYAKKSYLAKTLYKPLTCGNTKAFYRQVKHSKVGCGNVIPDISYNNIKAETSADKADIFNKFFQSVFINDDGADLPPNFHPYPIDQNELTVDRAGVLNLLQTIDISKSGGPDGITGILLKTFSKCIAESLACIFQYSIDISMLPDIWKTAKVLPVYKKGDRHKPNNYRPISLTCLTCKFLEHIIAKHIHIHLESNNILTDSQHGFRSNRSCETQLIHTLNDLALNKEKGLVTDVIILDFSKAFDSVNHRKLLFKLQKFGIHPKLLQWVNHFLENRQQSVQIDGVESMSCTISSGVPQGSVLGPLMFLLYINDLPHNIASECRLFADDALLYNVRSSAGLLQEDLKKFDQWSLLWQLTFNTSKCSVLSIGETNSVQQYFLNNSKINNVNSHPYLGVELSSDLKWAKHITNMEAKANRLLGLLTRTLKTADTKTRKIAYETLMRPVLEYGSQVWDPFMKKDIGRIEKIQNRALRFIFKLKGPVSFKKLREDADISSLAERRKLLRKKIFVKLHQTGVTSSGISDPQQHYNTRQESGLFIPSIKTNIYYNSFWPRTTRDIRDD